MTGVLFGIIFICVGSVFAFNILNLAVKFHENARDSLPQARRDGNRFGPALTRVGGIIFILGGLGALISSITRML